MVLGQLGCPERKFHYSYIVDLNMRQNNKALDDNIGEYFNNLRVRKELFYFLKINLFIYFWLRWVFIAACGLSLAVASGGYSLLE